MGLISFICLELHFRLYIQVFVRYFVNAVVFIVDIITKGHVELALQQVRPTLIGIECAITNQRFAAEPCEPYVGVSSVVKMISRFRR